MIYLFLFHKFKTDEFLRRLVQDVHSTKIVILVNYVKIFLLYVSLIENRSTYVEYYQHEICSLNYPNAYS